MFWDNLYLRKSKLAAYAILKPIKSDIFWTKCNKKAYEATFPTKFGIPDLMVGFLMRS